MLTAALGCLINHGYSEGLGGRDATIVATLNSQGITKIMSHDGVFKRLDRALKLEVIDPISSIR